MFDTDAILFFWPKSQRLSENRQMCQKWGILRPKFHNLIEVARYKGIHCSCIAKKILKNIINIAKHYCSFEFRLSSSGENNRPGSLNKTALFIFLYNVYIIWFHQLFQTWASTLVTCMLTHMHQGSIKGGKFLEKENVLLLSRRKTWWMMSHLWPEGLVHLLLVSGVAIFHLRHAGT